MKLIQGIQQLDLANRPSVVSIGNYDGVHLGHQYIVNSLLEQSQALGVPATVMTFEPLAKEFFNPNSVLRLSTIEERADYLFTLGVDQVVCIDFTQGFANLSPEQFVQDLLVDSLGARYVCVGDDFRFGKGRSGDFVALQTYGQQYDFIVQAHDTFEMGGVRVSSGRVREALLNNNFMLTERLLGRPFTMSGKVSKGQQLGRTINYPTANIVLAENTLLAVNGVYAVQVRVKGSDQLFIGVANVGNRPTVDGKENRIEVHIFDFDQDLYGQTLQVLFRDKIRDEQKFASLDALKTQITEDAEQARRFFAL